MIVRHTIFIRVLVSFFEHQLCAATSSMLQHVLVLTLAVTACRAAIVTSDNDELPVFQSKGVVAFDTPHAFTVYSGVMGTALETVLSPSAQIETIVRLHRVNPPPLPDRDAPACCVAALRDVSRSPELSLHFQPATPQKLGTWVSMQFMIPPGTHVLTAAVKCVRPSRATTASSPPTPPPLLRVRTQPSRTLTTLSCSPCAVPHV